MLEQLFQILMEKGKNWFKLNLREKGIKNMSVVQGKEF